MDHYLTDIKELSWSAQCLLLLACSLPLFASLTVTDDAVIPGMGGGAEWIVPLVIIVAFLFVGRVRLVNGKWTALDQAVLITVIGIAALTPLLVRGVLLFALVPVILVAMHYGRKPGMTLAGIISLVFAGYVYRSESLGFTEMYYASVIILFSIAYLVGGMYEMNCRLIRALADERANLVNLLNRLPVGVCVVDNDAQVVYRNPRIGDIESRMCRSLGDGGCFVHGAESRSAACDGGFTEVEFEGNHYRVSCSRLSEEGENTVIVINNVSEKHKLQEEIQKSSYLAAVGEMAAGVAHEIRNPLAVISGYTQLVREKRSDLTLGEIRPYLDVLQGEIAHLNRIVDDFVNLTAPSNLILVSTSLNDLVNDVQSFLRSEARRLDVTLHTELEAALPEIKGDPSRLRQVLFNLVGNAFQAVGPGGQVILRTFLDGGKICLAVEDDGPGIPESLQEKIFVPFFSTKDTGTGTGLAIAQRVIANHGGILTCSSQPGKTVFTVRFPLKHQAGTPPREAASDNALCG